MKRVGPGTAKDTSGGYTVCADGVRGHPLDKVNVVIWHGNFSAFNGYTFTPSDYSALRCTACGAYWRTKAAYVEEIDDAKTTRWVGE